MTARRIDYAPIDEIVPAVRNPKDHDIPGIRKSIEQFGVVEIGVVDERTGRLVSGHGRTEAYELLAQAAAAGVAPPDGIEVRDGKWYVPIVRGWESKNDEEAEAVVVALNRLTERGGWVNEQLADILSDLSNVEGLLEVTGYDQADLSDLLATVAPPPDLDDLTNNLGAPDPSDFWPVLRFKVAPATRDRWVALVGSVDGDDDARFVRLLDLAEQAPQPEPVETQVEPPSDPTGVDAAERYEPAQP